MTTSASTSTLSRFPAAAADFVRDLYVEHLEEVSFLYDQRNYLLEHVEMEPHDIAWNEQRCDRHLDALVAGGDLTLAMCRKRAAAREDDGELYAAMRVSCRADRPDLVRTALDELDAEDGEAMAAALDGLKHELPESWSALVCQWLDEVDEPRAAILAVASAYRGLAVGPAVTLYASGLLANPVPFLWALGRLREPTQAFLFRKYLQDGNDESKRAAAIGALRHADQRVAPMLRQAAARGEVWAIVPLALVGELSDLTTFERAATTAGPTGGLALALGLLGNMSAVDILLGWLEVDNLGDAAAMALHLLTGLCPLEKVPGEEAPTTESDHGDDEDEAGFERVVLSRSRGDWQAPCERFRREATESARTRQDIPDSMTPTLIRLASPRLPVHVRDLLSDACLIRHNFYAAPCDAWKGARPLTREDD